MKKIFFLLLLFAFCPIIFGQNEASYWYFGENAGLRFDGTSNSVTVLDGELNTLEGCASISDSDGQLLFYTDGRFVWDRNNNVMPNGIGLYGDPSSTQSAIIIPKPQDENIYFIFTVDTVVSDNDPDFGFNYSEVDMTLNGGLGDVVESTKNINLLEDSSEKISAVLKDCETEHVYVVTLASEDGSPSNSFTHFHVYEVTTTGILTLPPQNIPAIYDQRGYLKFSPDGTKLVSANVLAGLYIYDFNVSDGTITNPIQLTAPQPLFSTGTFNPYGVEFSQSNQFLYVSFSNDIFGQAALNPSSHNTALVQYNLNAQATNNFEPIIISQEPSNYRGALQLALNGKIYRALASTYFIGKPNLGVVNNPDALGPDCNYDHTGISLAPNNSFQGLPPFIQSLFNSQIDIIRNDISATELKLCEGDSYTLIADDISGADYVWSSDGNPLPETSSQLFIDTSGFYEVYIEPNNGDCPIEGRAVVTISDFPIANSLTRLEICDYANNDGIYTFDFTDKNSETLLDQDPTKYNVLYFETLADANNLENEITFPYTNINNPQTIFVRVINIDNPNCIGSNNINQFDLQVYNTPQIPEEIITEEINFIEICDNHGNKSDGIGFINLEDLKPNIRGNQNESETAITFHLSQENADDNTEALPLNHTNVTPFIETIYIRIENTESGNCYSTGSLIFFVNPIPIANNTYILQCDEDGIPEGFTTFNINNQLEAITDDVESNSVEFYLSLIDAENQENAINGDAFDNFFNPQIVYARVTNISTGCINFSEISLEVPTTSSNNASLELCDIDGTEDGFMAFNLTEANATILAFSPTDLDLVYYETYEDALLENNPLGATFTNTIPYFQTIYGRVENMNACYGISEIELTVFELPTIETEFETLYCLNSSPETITLDGGILEDAPSNYYYEWSTGESTSEIEIDTPGTYNVRVSNTNGCFKDRTITVLPSNIATITQIEVVDGLQHNSISIFIDENSEGDYEYALNNIDGPYQNSNTFSNVQPGLYTVYVRDKNDCGILEDLVSVIGFPKFFTPNNDDVNDYWKVYGISEQFQTNSIIYIFDRYGKLIKELDPLGSGWDGNYNGEKMPTSDYWFKVTLEDGRTFTNHFTLKR